MHLCGKVSAATGLAAVVLALAPPADSISSSQVRPVVVTNIGFQLDKTSPSSSIIDYGVTLTNRSRTQDAHHVTIVVRAVDARGRSVTSDETTLSAIPAGQKFVIAGLMAPGVSLSTTKLRVTVRTRTQARSLRLPVATHVVFDGSGGELYDVKGRFRNPYRKALPEGTRIYAVVLDKRGQIVTGTSDETGARVLPGRTVSFDLEDVINDPNVHPVSARVSIDPCAELDLEFGDCSAASFR